MKILVYTESFGTTTTTFIYNEVRGQEKFHSQKVICFRYEKPSSFPFSLVDAISNYPYSRTFTAINMRLQKWGLAWPMYDPLYAKRLNRAIEESTFDLIHIHFGLELIRFYDLISSFPQNIPVIVSFHGYDASRLLKEKHYVNRLKKILGRSNVFIVVASHFMKHNLERVGIPTGRLKVIYYGTDTKKFVPGKRSPTDSRMFLQVSSFREKKGHTYSLQAFSKFLRDNPDKQAKLVFAGGGDGLEAVRNYAAELGIGHLVEFTGWVSHEQTQALMQQADVFVHHSITPESGDEEGVPNAIIEAMSMELPILSTQHAGIPELVEDGVHGYLVPERDVDAYARRMADIFDWPRQPQNREKVKAQFDLEVHTRELAAWYEFAHSAVRKKT